MASLKDINTSIEEGNDDLEKLSKDFAEWFKLQKQGRLDDLEDRREKRKLNKAQLKAVAVPAAAGGGGKDKSDDDSGGGIFPRIPIIPTALLGLALLKLRKAIKNKNLKNAELTQKNLNTEQKNIKRITELRIKEGKLTEIKIKIIETNIKTSELNQKIANESKKAASLRIKQLLSAKAATLRNTMFEIAKLGLTSDVALNEETRMRSRFKNIPRVSSGVLSGNKITPMEIAKSGLKAANVNARYGGQMETGRGSIYETKASNLNVKPNPNRFISFDKGKFGRPTFNVNALMANARLGLSPGPGSLSQRLSKGTMTALQRIYSTSKSVAGVTIESIKQNKVTNEKALKALKVLTKILGKAVPFLVMIHVGMILEDPNLTKKQKAVRIAAALGALPIATLTAGFGAIAGSFVVPPVGTIIGGVLGAILGYMAAEQILITIINIALEIPAQAEMLKAIKIYRARFGQSLTQSGTAIMHGTGNVERIMKEMSPGQKRGRTDSFSAEENAQRAIKNARTDVLMGAAAGQQLPFGGNTSQKAFGTKRQAENKATAAAIHRVKQALASQNNAGAFSSVNFGMNQPGAHLRSNQGMSVTDLKTAYIVAKDAAIITSERTGNGNVSVATGDQNQIGINVQTPPSANISTSDLVHISRDTGFGVMGLGMYGRQTP